MRPLPANCPLLFLFVLRKIRPEKGQITIVNLLWVDGEVSLPVLLHWDILRLDVPARQSKPQLVLRLHTMLEDISFSRAS